MIKVRCPACGRIVNSDEIIDGVCRDCWNKRKDSKELSIKSLRYCPICGRVKYMNKWVDVQKFLNKILDERVYIYYIKDNKIVAESEEFYYEFYFKKEICPVCRKIKNKYYDVILQLRGNRDKIDEFLKHLMKILSERREILLTDLKQRKEGIDLYLTNFLGVKRIIYSLRRVYNYEIKMTRKLHTQNRQTSKRVYKSTILLKFSE